MTHACSPLPSCLPSPPLPAPPPQAGDKQSAADLELLLMDDGALRDAARGVKSRVLPAGHDAAEAGKRKLTKKVGRGLTGELVGQELG